MQALEEEEEEVVAPPSKKSKKDEKTLPAKKTKAIVRKEESGSSENEASGSEPERKQSNSVQMSKSEPKKAESNAEPVAIKSKAKPATVKSKAKPATVKSNKEQIAESGEYRPDWSKLPVEMLEILFQYCDNRIALKETCKKFRQIRMPPQAPTLDFDRISSGNAFPRHHRAYETVKIVGKKVRGTEAEFRRALRSSQSSARKLVLGRRLTRVPAPYWDQDWRRYWVLVLPDYRRLGGQISAQRFQYLLSFFPNIETIEIQGFATAIGEKTPFELLDLPNLKKLCLRDITYQFLAFFSRVQTLDELIIGGYFDRKSTRAIQNLIVSQKGLTSLDISYSLNLPITLNADDSLPNLRTLKGIVKGKAIFDIFKLAPNLQHLELEIDEGAPRYEKILRKYLISVNCLTLETLIITGYRGDINEFRANFPSLTIV